MADMMKVLLSAQAAAAVWGEGALLSFSGEETLIHLGATAQQQDRLRTIQRAARRLESSGIKRVSLAGEGWDLERRYAFAQGFYAALRELDEAHAELIVIEALPDNNAWSAIADRLRRAACGAGM